MPYLSELHEWQVLQRLGALLIDKKAHCHEPSHPWQGGPEYHDHAFYEVMALEIELRQVFLIRESDIQLVDDDLEPCWAQLRALCRLLKSLVHLELCEGDTTYPNSSYPHLWELVRFLEGLKHEAVFDLVGGANNTLFRYLPESRRADLKIVTNFNEYMDQLFATQFRPAAGSSRKVKDTAWKNTQLRNQTSAVFRLLFDRFTCKISHEVLMKISEEIAQAGQLPKLQLLLSSCSASNNWQETLCAPNEKEDTIRELKDICLELQQFQGQGQELHLSIQEHQLFGVWAWQAMGKPPLKTIQKLSLDELIINGDFKPLSCHSLISESSITRYNRKDKRALALKLGFCLLDFFDSQLDSTRIHFLISNDGRPDKNLLYLSFSSKPKGLEESRDFRMGHPVLLSFAKLLIEIEEGDTLPLNINSQYGDQNKQTWAKLFDCVQEMEIERNDSYIDAVLGCLNVHQQIRKSLREENLSGDKADLRIREELYHHIVRKLELSLAECTTRKRQRSESPEPLKPNATVDTAFPRPNTSFHEVQDRKGKRRESWANFKRGHTVSTQEASSAMMSKFRGSWGTTSVLENKMANFTASHMPNKRTGHSYRGSRTPQSPESTPEISSDRVTTPYPRPSSRDEFEVTIICALPLEYDAVSHMFDCFWDGDGDPYGKAKGDVNTYTTGRIGNVDVVFVLLPEMGKASAAAAASLRSSYSALKLALLVGICGGVPRPNGKGEMLLGDVIVSRTIVQYDLGRRYPEGFKLKEGVEATLGRPTKSIRNMISRLETLKWRRTLEQRAKHFLEHVQSLNPEKHLGRDYTYPGAENDRLFPADYRHKHRHDAQCLCTQSHNNADPICASCHTLPCNELGCSDEHLVRRKRLERKKELETRTETKEAQAPSVFTGKIGSGDTVYKSAEERDMIAKHYDILSLEMEGAGIWDELPCIVVKGVCDYADSHKNKQWQDFAAMTAAATTKALLEQYIKTDHCI